MLSQSPIRLTLGVICTALGLCACGSSGSEGDPGGSTGGATGSGGSAGGTTVTGEAKAHGMFEIHYVTGATASSSYAEIGGFMYDGPPNELVIWEKKKTEGDCSLYTPRTPFCASCDVSAGEQCVGDDVCRTPPSTHDVGAITLTGLHPPSGANPLALTAVTNAAGTTYLCAETLPVPPCAEGGAVRLDAAGQGDYAAFGVQTQCIAPLLVTNPTIAIESGKTLTLNWTPSSATAARVEVELDLSHHGGSKGKLICETADTGSLQIAGTLIESLIALGVTGYPKAVVTRALTGNAPVGSGQAELKIYSDLYFVVEIPGLLSCQNDSDCPTGQTCQVPGQMCGISCTSNADCPSGQTCLATTNICQ